MIQETRVLSPFEQSKYQLMLDNHLKTKPRTPAGFYEIRSCVGALLIDELNGTAGVFVYPDTLFIYSAARGDGTDKLRARIHAGMFFDSIAAKINTAPTKEVV